MRITNATISTNAVRALLTNQRGIDRASRQISSGLRFERVSGDPTAGSDAMRATSDIKALAQYRRNIQRAAAVSNTQEGVLNALTDVLVRAQELAVQQASSTNTPQTRSAVKAEIDQLLRMAITLGNTQVEGAYLFGGAEATTPPVTLIDGTTPNFAVASTAPAAQFELSAGQRIRVAERAADIFGTTGGGTLAALRELSLALEAGDIGQISAAGASLNAAYTTVQNTLGATGARSNQLDVTRTNLDALDVTLKVYRSELIDVEVEAALAELVAKQTTYQAAMLATTRVIDLNLGNYLR